jgi:hypothetical protein
LVNEVATVAALPSCNTDGGQVNHSQQSHMGYDALLARSSFQEEASNYTQKAQRPAFFSAGIGYRPPVCVRKKKRNKNFRRRKKQTNKQNS